MSRLAGLILLLVILLAGVFYWQSQRGQPQPDAGVAGQQAADEAVDADGSAADAAADAAETAADAAAEAAATTGDDSAPAPALDDAAREAQAAAEAAIEAAAAAADAAAQAEAGAETGTPDTAAAATEAASDAAREAADAAAEAASASRTAVEIDRLLTPEGFNAAEVEALIDSSSLDPAQRDSLKAAVAASASRPPLLRAPLEQARALLRGWTRRPRPARLRPGGRRRRSPPPPPSRRPRHCSGSWPPRASI
ncbi:MAG TPA: hypothetical protein PKA35_14275 [Paracoccus solventivorans]|uniref:hypothetical protein n=1 Tax=Paracoccus solventivorans TaxID=53463 RepID=UPI002C990C5C|nr:hypothetical protein [Paracoccus solventivorans]HMM10262.1 hypothetical protein [Paracoccus solventivorans]